MLLIACGFSSAGVWGQEGSQRSFCRCEWLAPVQYWPCAGVVCTKVFDLPEARAWAWNQLLGKNGAPVMCSWVADGICSCGWSNGVGQHVGRRWCVAG